MKKIVVLFCLFLSFNLYSEEVDSDNKYCSREYCDIYLCISDYIENNNVVTPDIYEMAEGEMSKHGYNLDSCEKNRVRLYPKVYVKEDEFRGEVVIDCEELKERYGKFVEFEVEHEEYGNITLDALPVIYFGQPRYEEGAVLVNVKLKMVYTYDVALMMKFKLVEEEGKYRVDSCEKWVKM